VGDQALRIEVRPNDARGPAPATPAEPPLVEVRARPTVVDSCTYCHDAIGAREEVALCPRCQSTLHGACRATIDRCPTLGCDGITDRPADRLFRSPEAELERGGFTQLGALVFGPIFGALALPVLFFALTPPPPMSELWDLASPITFMAVMGAMLGLMLGAAVGLAVDLVGLRSRAVAGTRVLTPLLVVLLAAAGAAFGRDPLTMVLLGACWGSVGLVAGLRLFGSPLR